MKLRLRHLGELDSCYLRSLGIKAIGLDKDNVLTYPDDPQMHASVKGVVERLKMEFPLAVFSNSIGSRVDYLPNLQRFIGSIPVVEHGTSKPRGGPILLRYFRRTIGLVEPREIAFIGDRVLTDMLFAKLNNFFPILIDPLDAGRDPKVIQMIRFLEKYLI